MTLTVNVIATLLMAPALLLLLLLVNDREIMGGAGERLAGQPGRRNRRRGHCTRWCASTASSRYFLTCWKIGEAWQ